MANENGFSSQSKTRLLVSFVAPPDPSSLIGDHAPIA
jgi:hypothetical protein